MSEKLNAMRAEECFDELYGVDGDGLGEGEVACEAELDYDPWAWTPSYYSALVRGHVDSPGKGTLGSRVFPT